MVGSAMFTTDSSIYEIVDAMMVTASTHGLLPPAQSVALTDRIAASSQGRGFGLGMRNHMCLAVVNTNTAGRAELVASPRRGRLPDPDRAPRPLGMHAFDHAAVDLHPAFFAVLPPIERPA